MKNILFNIMLFILCASSFITNEFCLAKISKSEIFASNKEERRDHRREKYKRKISRLHKKETKAYVTRVEPSVASEQMPITIVIYAQNAANWVDKNLDSVFKQQYQNYRVVYINDASIDSTDNKLEEYITTRPTPCNLEIVTYQEPQGKLSAFYTAIHNCDDEEIIVLLDAQDWLANEWILGNLNKEYRSKDIWLTFGTSTSEPKGCNIGLRNGTVPDEIQQKRYFRKIFPYMPLRTFYAWLFKEIHEEDLIDPTTNNFFEHAAECYIMWPLIEMADTHFKIFNEITYVVNCNDPIAKLIEDYHLRMACNSQMGKDLPVYQPIAGPSI